MTFEKWLDMLIDEEVSKNPELKKVFDEHPERRELYKSKLIESDAENDGLKFRYRQDMEK